MGLRMDIKLTTYSINVLYVNRDHMATEAGQCRKLHASLHLKVHEFELNL